MPSFRPLEETSRPARSNAFKEALRRRSEMGGTPEGRLIVALIGQALDDMLDERDLTSPKMKPQKREEIRAARLDAERFFGDWRMASWAESIGIAPEFVLRLASDAIAAEQSISASATGEARGT